MINVIPKVLIVKGGLDMGQLTKRKILKQGNSAMLTLPPGWLRFHNLKPGDVVTVVSNGKLTVLPAKGYVPNERKKFA